MRPKNTRKLLLKSLRTSICFAGLLSGLTFAAQDIYVPPELDAWKDWVLEDHPNIYCPIDDTSARRLPCVWISELSVDLTSGTKDRVTFRITGQANADSSVELPSSDKRPVAVQLNDLPASVGFHNDSARVFVKPGTFTITGHIDFDTVPRSLGIPRSAAIVRLSIDGEEVPVPKVEEGKLWLQSQALVQESENALRLDVYRRLRDDIPQTLDTWIRLTVDGEDRVETLGKLIFDGFDAISVNADVPVQITEDGTFLIQASRGVATLSVRAVSERVMSEFTPTSTGSHWPLSETWVFIARTQHRTVDIEGVEPVDPTLVDSPFGSAPTYTVPLGTTLKLTNELRGDPNPKPALFNIAREIWLGFDGSSMVASDKIFANVQSETRIGADYDLGAVSVDGSNRLVTYLDKESGSEAGITLHPSERKVDAVSLLNSRSDISANGWLIDSDSLNINLNVPPGWKLLWTSGVDRVDESWLSAWWNLWDIFICVLIVVVLYRVGGIPVAVVVSIAILFGYQEHTAPAIGWLLLGVILLLDRQFSSDTAKRVTQIVYWTLLVPVAVISVYVAASNLRQAVYPQLDAAIAPALTPVAVANVDEVETLVVDPRSMIRRDNFDLPSPVVGKDQSKSSARNGVTESAAVVVSGNFIRDSVAQQPIVAVQTGPGKPTWTWDQVTLDWTGPVSKDQRVGLTFLPPPATRVVFALIAVLHLLMLLIFVMAKVGNHIDLPPRFRKVAPLLLLGIATTSVNASFPDSELLEELEERLTALPECVPGCASLEQATLTMDDENELRLDLTILAGAEVAVPLPKGTPYTSLKEVSQGGRPLPLLLSSNSDTFVVVDDGQNHLSMVFNVRDIDDLVIDFSLEPAHISKDVCCWRVSEGVESDRRRIVMNRQREDSDGVSLMSSTYEFQRPVTVERELDLRYEPVVNTTVRINKNRAESISVEIPLLDGETVLDNDITVRNGSVILIFEPNVDVIRWRSSILLDDVLAISAPTYTERTEKWFVRGSDFWQFKGIGVTPSQSERNATVYLPRQGETLTLRLSQPTPVPGNTLTVNNVELTSTVGSRASTNTALFHIESSVADAFSIELPVGSMLEGVTIDGRDQPLSTGTLVNFPVTHGEHAYGVSWRMEEALGWLYRTPDLAFSGDARNVSHTVQLAKSRWILFLGGPAIGSAVLFWGVVIVTVLVGLTLTFLPKFPLTKVDAILVAVGATLANIWALLFVALWTLGVWWRARTNLGDLPVYVYRIIQMAVGLLAVVGLLALFFTVLNALQTPPDMYITSSSILGDRFSYSPADSHLLRWFADESSVELPTAWVFSLPFWVYQLTMLAWSLWLVFALIKWVRTTFTALSVPTFWGANERRESIEDDAIEEVDAVDSTDSDTEGETETAKSPE
ncbi:MAG: hypothetical protein OXG15_11680 [Gammaproteobacteria bacterium]|nr:hypothetical protein [Gammaproteobacteria bacterium]